MTLLKNASMVAVASNIPGMGLSQTNSTALTSFLNDKTDVRGDLIDFIETESALPGHILNQEMIMEREWWDEFFEAVPPPLKDNPLRDREVFFRYNRSRESDSIVDPFEPINNAESEAIACSMIFSREDLGYNIEDVDLLLTYSRPDLDYAPTNAVEISRLLGIDSRLPAVSIHAQCASGEAMFQAAVAFVKSGMYKNVLCSTSCHVGSLLQDQWANEPATVVWGDCASAFLVSEVEAEYSADYHNGRSMGKYFDGIKVNINPYEVEIPNREHARVMLDVFVEDLVEEIALDLFEQSGGEIGLDDISMIIGHQGFSYFAFVTADRLGISHDRVFSTYRKYGNVGSNTWLVSLHDAFAAGLLNIDDYVMICQPGMGFVAMGSVLKVSPELYNSVQQEWRYDENRDRVVEKISF